MSANSTLVHTGAGSMWSFGFDNVSYQINGEIFGSWDSYANNVRLTVGTTGVINETSFMQMNQLYLHNHGTIQSLTNMAISKYDDAQAGWSNDLIVYNTGNILGGPNNIYADRGVIDSSGDRNEIVNFGFIGGSDLAIRTYDNVTNDGETYIENHGTIGGAIQVGTTTADWVINSGDIFGDVSLGGGNDTYRAIDDGSVDGTISGEDGDDTLKGGSGDDDFDGGKGKDTLIGRGGDDTMNGGGQNDTMRGGAGDDTMNGDGGNDSMDGGSGDDTMNGGAGKDVMTGGSGDDVMTGGSGADDFVILRDNGNDWITDFADGIDEIDISAYGILAADFAAVVAPGLSETASGSTLLDLSVLGGSGTVLIEGVALTNITAADFIF
ncbi:hypothetical protein LCL97_07180 [Seohaeicola saemankumensis]|nr:calcium-binding protein [Seohaeicola saemankumensis]MCA0870599.1 hypothetical protein [Seohaeicola saemankumensis]